MNWIANTLWSSVGKKLLMAVTGLGFIGFLAAHLAGNLTIYSGKDAFNAYAESLHSLGPLLTVAEWGLLFCAVIHVLTGAVLFYQNFRSRPVRYAVNKNAGGRTIGSFTQPYTGFLILAFVIFHLANFHFVDKSNTTIYQIVSNAFTNTGYVCVYILAMIVVAIHVSHGFWSLFQTIGANHPKYMPIIKGVGLVFTFAVALGFGLLPIYLLAVA